MATRKKQPPAVIDTSDSSWHLDRKVPVAIILALGLQTHAGQLPQVSDNVRADIDKAFTNTVPPHSLTLSGFAALHGGMVYPPLDPSAKQATNFPPLTDQRNNAIWGFPISMQTLGGFTNDANTPVAFVGQA